MGLNLKPLKTIGVSLLFSTVSVVAHASSDAPDWVKIKTIRYAGTGCPAGSVAENVSFDKLAFTLLFDKYVAEAGPRVPNRDKRKNCVVNIVLDFPSGWSFTILDIDTRGYASLDRGVTG